MSTVSAPTASPASPTALSTSSSSSTAFSSSQPHTSATTPEPLPPSTTPIAFPSDGMPQHLSQPPPPRRKASIYPLAGKQNNPFSRSAAKRESVMMLGSIEHLQHYFTKQGIAAKQKPSRVQSQLVPAIGPAERRISNPVTPSTSQTLGELPPSPAIPPPRPAFLLPSVLDVREKHDPHLLRPQVLAALEEVEALWAVESVPEHSTSEAEKDTPLSAEGLRRGMDDQLDVLHSLLRTTHLIRQVRNYVLSLPSSASSPPPPPQQATFRPNNLTPQPIPRTRTPSGSALSSSTATAGGAAGSSSTDPSAKIRHAALELLAQLRLFEESARLGPAQDPELEPEETSSDVSSLGPPRALSPATGYPSRGPSPLPPMEPEQESDGEEKKREAWDERLVLGGGFLYRTDLRLGDCEVERRAVAGYLRVVDGVLFGGGGKDGRRGWRRPQKEMERSEWGGSPGRRRVSGGSLLPGGGKRPGVGRRVVSAAGFLESALGGRMSEEPEGISSLGEEDGQALGGIAEGDEDVIVEEDEGEEGEEGDLSLMSTDESSLPAWAQTSAFNTLEDRLYALLHSLLPSSLLEHLPPPSPAEPFWLGLQSGQLLCIAYNTAVRRSSKPWGYIEPRAIHDIIALDLAASQPPPPPPPEKEVLHPLHHAIGPQFTGRKRNLSPDPPAAEPLLPQLTGSARKEGGWTFRRTENLRLFAAACRLRYLIPFVSTPLAQGQGRQGKGEMLVWDPKVLAAKGDGWEGMMKQGVAEWVERVVQERREGR